MRGIGQQGGRLVFCCLYPVVFKQELGTESGRARARTRRRRRGRQFRKIACVVSLVVRARRKGKTLSRLYPQRSPSGGARVRARYTKDTNMMPRKGKGDGDGVWVMPSSISGTAAEGIVEINSKMDGEMETGRQRGKDA